MMRLLYAIEAMGRSIAELEQENDTLFAVLRATALLLEKCDDLHARAAGAALSGLAAPRERLVHGEHRGPMGDVQEWIALQGGFDGAVRRLADWQEAQDMRQVARRQLEDSFKLEHLGGSGDRAAGFPA